MSDHHDDPTREMIEEYVLGLVDAADASRIEARMAGDPAFAAQVITMRETVTALAMSTPVTPSPVLKARVLERIAATPTTQALKEEGGVIPLTPRSRTTAWLGFALAASLALLAKVSFDLRAARRGEIDAAALVAARDATIARRDSLLATLTDPSMEMVTLAATGEKRPMVRAYIDHSRHTMTLMAASLDAVPTGRVYQVWFIMDGKPVPSVTFVPGADGRAMIADVAMPSGAIAATTITAEPMGGSPAPSSPVLFMGRMAADK